MRMPLNTARLRTTCKTAFCCGPCAPTRLGTTLLEKSQRGVKHQQHRDDSGFDKFAKHQFQQYRRFQHPRNWGPEFGQSPAQGIHGSVRHGIGTGLFQPAASLIAGDPILGIVGWNSDVGGSSSGRSKRHRLTVHQFIHPVSFPIVVAMQTDLVIPRQQTFLHVFR